jgi:hypothetical protein
VDNINVLTVLLGVFLVIGIIVLISQNISHLRVDLKSFKPPHKISFGERIRNILKYSDQLFRI